MRAAHSGLLLAGTGTGSRVGICSCATAAKPRICNGNHPAQLHSAPLMVAISWVLNSVYAPQYQVCCRPCSSGTCGRAGAAGRAAIQPQQQGGHIWQREDSGRI